MPDHSTAQDFETSNQLDGRICPVPAGSGCQWSKDRPAAPGVFILLADGYGSTELVAVKYGDWRQAQNPEWLYAGPDLLYTITGWWFGPIPGPPCNKVTLWHGVLPYPQHSVRGLETIEP